ncbi:hypothetical protein CDD80_4008 [Ophiocordyceps camponoti-rufipedis]|uniref:Uncharacterized protein n=1 Tax=Ophiocordyceps camponoti-rufipedis TaxID=2004952 RepID=A0A2C5YUE2_9HYPO|nr:hypothetical protein CDD80_4008 [Ophiocordyceps camponoti-rufipedis]
MMLRIPETSPAFLWLPLNNPTLIDCDTKTKTLWIKTTIPAPFRPSPEDSNRSKSPVQQKKRDLVKRGSRHQFNQTLNDSEAEKSMLETITTILARRRPPLDPNAPDRRRSDKKTEKPRKNQLNHHDDSRLPPTPPDDPKRSETPSPVLRVVHQGRYTHLSRSFLRVAHGRRLPGPGPTDPPMPPCFPKFLPIQKTMRENTEFFHESFDEMVLPQHVSGEAGGE